MDDSVPLVIWIVGLSGLTVFVVFALLLGAMLSHQRRLAEETARWGRHLMEALDGERDRIAGELHDDMVPRLIATRLSVEQGGLTDQSGALNEVISGLRGLAHQLHPPALRHLDLGRALADLADDLWQGDGPEISVVINGEPPDLDGQTSLALYRIAQEAVINAIRHAEASTVTMSLSGSERETVLSVRDDGRGLENAAAFGMGFGTRSMRERAKSVGGTLDVQSAQGAGTTITCTVVRR